MFDEWKHQAIDDVREVTRAHVAKWHGCSPERLTAHAERCSVKVAGCLPLSAHLDQGRVGTIQVVIALSPTKFVIWPRSHTVALNPQGKGYYVLTPTDLAKLQTAGSVKTEIPSDPGDVLFFLGGKIVHGSPAVVDNEGTRFATYAHWIPPE